jgi:hypothetical protein
MDALTAEIGRLRLQVHNLKGESGAQNISIGNYLLARLEQLGVRVSDTFQSWSRNIPDRSLF